VRVACNLHESHSHANRLRAELQSKSLDHRKPTRLGEIHNEFIASSLSWILNSTTTFLRDSRESDSWNLIAAGSRHIRTIPHRMHINQLLSSTSSFHVRLTYDLWQWQCKLSLTIEALDPIANFIFSFSQDL